MFDEPSEYPREKVKLFMRYLVNAASKSYVHTDYLNISKPFLSNNNVQSTDERLESMNSERKEELEIKINAFYTKNKYMPIELKLKKLKLRFNELRRTKKGSTKKIEKIEEKITRCQELLRRIKHIDMMNNRLHI